MRSFMKHFFFVLVVAMLFGSPRSAWPNDKIYWLNHLDLLPGDSSVQTTFQALSCPGVGGLTGLAIKSTTTGELGPDGENKVVETGIPVPPDFLIRGVRVCYQVNAAADADTFISQIRLCQLQDPSSSCSVLLDDATDQLDDGPVCVNSSPTFIDPDPPDAEGSLLLSLRVKFGSTADTICVRGVGLILAEPEKGMKRCTDGIDNDGDGLTDGADPDCTPPLQIQ